MNKKTQRDIDLKGKKVIVRCDFNVPIENGKVLDDTKIVKSLKTINYLLDNNCSLILLSHLGRVKSKKDKIDTLYDKINNTTNVEDQDNDDYNDGEIDEY